MASGVTPLVIALILIAIVIIAIVIYLVYFRVPPVGQSTQAPAGQPTPSVPPSDAVRFNQSLRIVTSNGPVTAIPFSGLCSPALIMSGVSDRCAATANQRSDTWSLIPTTPGGGRPFTAAPPALTIGSFVMIQVTGSGGFSSSYLGPCSLPQGSGFTAPCGGNLASLTSGSGGIWRVASASPGLAAGSYVILGQTSVEFVSVGGNSSDTIVLGSSCAAFLDVGCGLPLAVSASANFSPGQRSFTLVAGR